MGEKNWNLVIRPDLTRGLVALRGFRDDGWRGKSVDERLASMSVSLTLSD